MPSYADIIADLPRYGEWRPTSFDSRGLGLPERQDWRVLPAMLTRDSGVLARSNFRVACTSLATVDPDGEHHERHTFGHWGPGWIEIIVVNPNAPDAVITEAGGIAASLESYPVLSESDYSELEWATAADTWCGMSTRERIEVCARYRVSIFAARRDDVPECSTGEIIGYLASE